MLEKVSVDIKEYKGHPHLELTSHNTANKGKDGKYKNLVLRFGYTKCNLILDCIEKIQDFVYEENDKKMGFNGGSNEQG